MNEITFADIGKELDSKKHFTKADRDLAMIISWPVRVTKQRLYRLISDYPISNNMFKTYILNKIVDSLIDDNFYINKVKFLFRIKDRIDDSYIVPIMTGIGEKLIQLKNMQIIKYWIEALAKQNLLSTILEGDWPYLINDDFYLQKTGPYIHHLENDGQYHLLNFYLKHVPTLHSFSSSYWSPFNPRYILRLPTDTFMAALQTEEVKESFLKIAIGKLPYHRDNEVILKIIGLLHSVSKKVLMNVLYTKKIEEYLLKNLPTVWYCYLHPFIRYEIEVGGWGIENIAHVSFDEAIIILVRKYEKSTLLERESLLAEIYVRLNKDRDQEFQ